MNYWTNIDWEATGAMFQGLGTIGGAAAVYFAAKVGLQAWRQQKIAERNRDEAEVILRAVYNSRRALRYIRSPLMTSYELENAKSLMLEKYPTALDHKTDSQQRRMMMANAYFIRLDEFKSERKSLEDCLPMARALFGESVEQSLEDLHHQFHVISVDAEAYADDVMESDKEYAMQVRRSLFSTGTRREGIEDKVTESIEKATNLIENTCLPYLRLESR